MKIYGTLIKSDNAIEAESYNRYCITTGTKVLRELLKDKGIKATLKKCRILIEDNCDFGEWHHVSKYANEVSYYDLNVIMDLFEENEICCFEDIDNVFIKQREIKEELRLKELAKLKKRRLREEKELQKIYQKLNPEHRPTKIPDTLENDYRGCGKVWSAWKDDKIQKFIYMSPENDKIDFQDHRNESRRELEKLGTVISGSLSYHEFVSNKFEELRENERAVITGLKNKKLFWNIKISGEFKDKLSTINPEIVYFSELNEFGDISEIKKLNTRKTSEYYHFFFRTQKSLKIKSEILESNLAIKCDFQGIILKGSAIPTFKKQ